MKNDLMKQICFEFSAILKYVKIGLMLGCPVDYNGAYNDIRAWH